MPFGSTNYAIVAMSIEPYIAGHPSADERQRLWHVRLQVFGVPEQV